MRRAPCAPNLENTATARLVYKNENIEPPSLYNVNVYKKKGDQ